MSQISFSSFKLIYFRWLVTVLESQYWLTKSVLSRGLQRHHMLLCVLIQSSVTAVRVRTMAIDVGYVGSGFLWRRTGRLRSKTLQNLKLKNKPKKQANNNKHDVLYGKLHIWLHIGHSQDTEALETYTIAFRYCVQVLWNIHEFPGWFWVSSQRHHIKYVQYSKTLQKLKPRIWLSQAPQIRDIMNVSSVLVYLSCYNRILQMAGL